MSSSTSTVRRKSNVKYYQHNQSDRMYLMANDDNRICDIYVPIPAAVDINLAEMAALEKSILAEHQIDPANFDGINFNLAIVDPNTTIVYYKLSSGLFDINSSQVVRKSH